MLVVDQLRHDFAGRAVLVLDHFSLDAGESALVLGASGSGKSTLLHIIAGLIRPRAGTVTIAGQSLAALSGSAMDRFRGQTIGFVPQRLHLIDSLDVRANLRLAQQLAGRKRDDDRIDAVLGSIGLSDKLRAHPAELSYGQAQRVAVARAVVNAPRLVLADEPTANLDDAHCEQTALLLEEQARAVGAALLIATHDQRLRHRIARQVVLQTPV